jgi:hypothetical protein
MHRAVVILALIGALQAGEWQSSFNVDKKNLGPWGSNRYFILDPGYRLHYAAGNETVVLTVLAETKTIDGVVTRAVEDREMKGGVLKELTRDYFAVDAATGDVYYFGEDVDVYKSGKVVSHEGAWLSGAKGARFGLMMPARPRVGRKFYQEWAPGIAMDRAEVVSVSETVSTPAGVFKNCVKIRETNPLEPRAVDYKWFAPGVGLVKDGDLALTRIEKPGQGKGGKR